MFFGSIGIYPERVATIFCRVPLFDSSFGAFKAEKGSDPDLVFNFGRIRIRSEHQGLKNKIELFLQFLLTKVIIHC